MPKIRASDITNALEKLQSKGIIYIRDDKIGFTENFASKLDKAVKNLSVQATLLVLKNYPSTIEDRATICLQAVMQFVLFEHLRPVKEHDQKSIIILTEAYKHVFPRQIRRFQKGTNTKSDNGSRVKWKQKHYIFLAARELLNDTTDSKPNLKKQQRFQPSA